MSNSFELPKKEQTNTYFVQNRASQDELTRLHIQDQMYNRGMGGVLREQPDPTRFQSVLDVGCGTGDWLIEAAKTYPHMTRLVGVDISKKMIQYARKQAAEERVSDRVQFHIMDALRLLEFPDRSFDLINQRFGVSWQRTWDWPHILQEYQRVNTWDGIIRITEWKSISATDSPALTHLFTLLVTALHHAGHLFIPQSDSVTHQLAPLLSQHGLRNVQSHSSTLEFRAGTSEGEHFAEDCKLAFRTLMPFFRKWNCLPNDYEMLYQQMLSEMQQLDSVVIWKMLTVWGNRTNLW
ncbi:MAG TPA: class I SAM-dependent methyltransferase [Ktedonosporobacter sp.]|nr:class I SAM-dependent methyltransferase [Ktedonosporobacter sp.]